MSEFSNIIIDDDLILDTNRDTIMFKSELSQTKTVKFPTEELNQQIDKLDEAIHDLETSLDPRTTSRLSYDNREGIYQKEALITNFLLGVVIALVFIILIL